MLVNFHLALNVYVFKFYYIADQGGNIAGNFISYVRNPWSITQKKISEPKLKSIFLYETKCLFVEVVKERLVFKFATLAVSR